MKKEIYYLVLFFCLGVLFGYYSWEAMFQAERYEQLTRELQYLSQEYWNSAYNISEKEKINLCQGGEKMIENNLDSAFTLMCVSKDYAVQQVLLYFDGSISKEAAVQAVLSYFNC